MNRINYSAAFERLWNCHPVGVKKLAHDQFQLLKITDEDLDNVILPYLEERKRLDKRWVQNGTVHHLRTILSQRHWENPYGYERLKQRPAQPYDRDLTDTTPRYSADPETVRAALAKAKDLVRH